MKLDPGLFHWFAAAMLAAASSFSHAQSCDAPLPAPGAPAPANGQKWRMIADQCDVLAGETSTHRAAQLDLYHKGASVTVGMPAAAPVQTPEIDLDSVGRFDSPLNGDGRRILSLAPTVTAAALAEGVDPLLLHAIAHVESRHRAGAVSKAGARGVMQVMPATGKRFGVADDRDLFDPATNIRASAAYIRKLLNRFGGDLRLVVAAYNAGEGAVEKYNRDVPPYAETQAYVRDVLSIYKRLTSAFDVTPAGTLVARNTGVTR